MKYIVTFEKYYEYEVEGNNADEAYENAYAEFEEDMLHPVVDTSYDDVEICLHEKFPQFIQ